MDSREGDRHMSY